jgi:hypothetical protein
MFHHHRHHRRRSNQGGIAWFIGTIIAIVMVIFGIALIAKMLPLIIVLALCSAMGMGKK